MLNVVLAFNSNKQKMLLCNGERDVAMLVCVHSWCNGSSV